MTVASTGGEHAESTETSAEVSTEASAEQEEYLEQLAARLAGTTTLRPRPGLPFESTPDLPAAGAAEFSRDWFGDRADDDG